MTQTFALQQNLLSNLIVKIGFDKIIDSAITWYIKNSIYSENILIKIVFYYKILLKFSLSEFGTYNIYLFNC